MFEDLAGLDDKFIIKNISDLPLFRQEQCAGYRQDIDKKTCIISYRILAKGLREQYGIETAGDFIYNQYGKPYLRDYPRIFFNISHCKTGVVCALADIEVGVDIQDIRPFDIDVAQRVCSENELRMLSASDEPAKLFCKIWTEKESYAKAEGISVSDVLRQDFPKSRIICWETANYCMTLRCKEIQAGKEAAYHMIKYFDLLG